MSKLNRAFSTPKQGPLLKACTMPLCCRKRKTELVLGTDRKKVLWRKWRPSVQTVSFPPEHVPRDSFHMLALCLDLLTAVKRNYCKQAEKLNRFSIPGDKASEHLTWQDGFGPPQNKACTEA